MQAISHLKYCNVTKSGVQFELASPHSKLWWTRPLYFQHVCIPTTDLADRAVLHSVERLRSSYAVNSNGTQQAKLQHCCCSHLLKITQQMCMKKHKYIRTYNIINKTQYNTKNYNLKRHQLINERLKVFR